MSLGAVCGLAEAQSFMGAASASACRSRAASARRLALGGLAVAPAGLGGLAGHLLACLRALRRQGLADGLAVRPGVAVGEGLAGHLAAFLERPPGRDRERR